MRLVVAENLKDPVSVKIEVEPIGHGPWMVYQEIVVQPGETFKHQFSENFQNIIYYQILN